MTAVASSVVRDAVVTVSAGATEAVAVAPSSALAMRSSVTRVDVTATSSARPFRAGMTPVILLPETLNEAFAGV